jgi:hypothetical protein
MTLIHVPRPPKSAFYKDRPVSSLLKNQIRHLQEAEFNLIKTEGEAAEYIRRVTAQLHPAGAKPQIVRRRKARPGRVKEIAAAAGRKTRATRGRKTKSKPKGRGKKAASKRKRSGKKRAS